jgi:hypothetical protein
VSFTFDASADPQTTLGWLRIRSGDTDSTYPLFTDGEMNALLTKFANDTMKCTGILFLVLSLDMIRLSNMLDACSNVTLVGLAETYAERSRSMLGG